MVSLGVLGGRLWWVDMLMYSERSFGESMGLMRRCWLWCSPQEEYDTGRAYRDGRVVQHSRILELNFSVYSLRVE